LTDKNNKNAPIKIETSENIKGILLFFTTSETTAPEIVKF
jgi:hypothetical protein